MNDGTPSLQPILDHAIAWTLVLFRIAGIFLTAPILTSIAIPMRFKALLAAMFAAAVYPVAVSHAGPAPATDLAGLIPLVMGELIIGFIIGSIAAIPLLMLELAGMLAGTTMGLGLARVYSPEMDSDSDLTGQLLFYVGMSIFIAGGGLNLMFRGVIDSFAHVQLGAFVRVEQPFSLFINVLTAGFELALRVAAPVVAIVFLMIIVFGVLGKTMPQLNVMSIGFALQALAGVAMLAWGMYAIREPVSDAITHAVNMATAWLADAPRQLQGAAR
jgi:flagellar biosynthesis protein FliR